jgi:hypothetical protein
MTRAFRNSITSDPAVLLARGYTARYLGAVLGGSITPLSSDEIDRDLQHMAAYQEATNRYQQVTYAATHSNSTRGITDETFPVRIDPEQEQRVELQRKRILRAEAVREELEQHYVALRAHYAMTGQQLQQTHRESVKTVEFLQSTVDQTASILALQRARLQMVRDCREALQARAEVEPKPPHKNDGSACPTLSLWIATEEELKKVIKTKRKVVTMNWSNTMEPTIPRNVPQFASILSTLPNHCLGYAASGVFGSKRSSIMYVDASPEADSDSSMAVLQAEVATLEKELQSEMNRNERLLDSSAKARKNHDEWVAMISLVRQETEAVLHRHNVLLESDEVRDAIAANYQPTEAGGTAAGPAQPGNNVDEDDEEDDPGEDNNSNNNNNSTLQQGEYVVDAVPGKMKAPSPGDEANEADDEGMVAEDEDESEANGAGKRPASGANVNSSGNNNNNEEEPRKKRRKL